MDCGFTPRCSLEVQDPTLSRMEIIIKLIEYCKYGIHDLSRTELDTKTKLPRFNMPFELGVFYGAKIFGNRVHNMKNCIIVDKLPYRYREFISDLSGTDIAHHNNSFEKAINIIRNWLLNSSRRSGLPSGRSIISRYRNFINDFRAVCRSHNTAINQIPFIELTKEMAIWLKLHQR